MPTAAAPERPAPPRSLPMYRALVGVGMACSLLIVSVFVLTGPVIERNRAEALQRAVFDVLPGATASASFFLTDDNSFRPAGEGDAPGRVVHAGFDADGQLVGVAVAAGAMGYQDIIELLYGYDPARQVIVGMQVLASKETPGLGDKIEKDPAFVANFTALDVSLSADGREPANPIEAVKHGEKTSPWQIDGITGATISSVAVATILRDSTRRWVPLIHRQRGDFQLTGGADGSQ